MIRRVFVANRGEIAVRIIRACQGMGIETVLGVSEADRHSQGAKLATRAVCIGPAPAKDSYLRGDTLVTAAKGTGCDAVHPGYGFLSERSAFRRLCDEADLAFIGPSAEAIEQMGDKITAINVARRVGVPVVPGRDRIASPADVHSAIREIGLPCLLKASAGGGGRGMRVIGNAEDVDSAFAQAQAEAKAAFGDGTLYLEKYIARARHIEIQVIADNHGNYRHLYERDCTVQRRHQKLVEEAPSPALTNAIRKEMTEGALALAREVGYSNAGTVEFVFDAETGDYYFLEMNTRVQVEHPVTEAVTGFDIVKEQITIAAGKELSLRQEEIELRGHAIECRINAEDAEKGFLPCPGKITAWNPQHHRAVRLDSHCFEGYVVPPYYDSMIGKAIAHGKDRDEAISHLERYLADFKVHGIVTTIPFQKRIVTSAAFRRAEVTTTWVERELMRF